MRSGGYNANSEEKKRREDRKFLDRIRGAGPDELEVLRKNHRHPDTPMWKKAAIIRALTRYTEKAP